MTKTNDIREKSRRLKEELGSKPTALEHHPPFKMMALRSSADMVGGIIVGTGGGLMIDHFFHTAHWGLIIGFFLGSAAGLLNVYRGLCKVGYGFKNGKEK